MARFALPTERIASRSAFDGIVPVLIATPPSTSRFSTTHTDLPSFDAWIAALCPAGPLPITQRSYRWFTSRLLLPNMPSPFDS